MNLSGKLQKGLRGCSHIRQIFIFSTIFTSKHLKGRSVPRVRHFFADAKDFVIFLFPDSFRIQRILSISCFQILSVFKGFCRFPVSRHFPYSRDFVVSLFLDTFRIQGILPFSCFQTLSVFKEFCRFPVSRHFP